MSQCLLPCLARLAHVPLVQVVVCPQVKKRFPRHSALWIEGRKVHRRVERLFQVFFRFAE